MFGSAGEKQITMKKLLLSLLIPCMLAGCVSTTKEKEHQQKDKRIKIFIDKFISTNPNYLNNEITQKEAAQRLAHEFLTLAQSDTLSCIADLPAKYEMMLAYPGDSLYVVKFAYTDLLNKHKVSKSYNFSYQAFSILAKEKAAKIVEGKNYYLSGNFIGFLTHDNFVLPSGNRAEDLPLISTFDDKPDISLGTLVIENLKLIPVK